MSFLGAISSGLRSVARRLGRVVPLGFALAAGCGGNGDYVDQLRYGSAERRAEAAAFLGAQRDARAVPALIVALQDTVPAVRAKAAWALGMVGAKQAFKPLIRMLLDASSRVRQQATFALMYLEEPEAIGPLEEALQRESSPWLQGDLRKAIEYLRQFEGDADISEGTFR